MLSSLIIVFREVLEAALVVGVLLAATRTLPGRGKWVTGGCLLGALGSVLTAFFTEAIAGALEGMGQEVFNSIVLFSAAALIGWHIIWMKHHAPALVKNLQNVGRQITEGSTPLYALAVVSGLAVLREGAEIVLFLYGVLVSGQSWSQVALGGTGGLLLGFLTGALLYLGLIRVPTKHIFSVTSLILTLLAAGMVSHALGYLSAVGVVPTLVDPLWDSSGALSEKTLLGQFLNVLIGYNESPSGMQVIGYSFTVGGIFVLLKLFGNSSVKTQKTVTALLISGIVFLGLCTDAQATRKVYSPLVEKGELEIEYRGSYAFDDRASKDGKQKHKLGVGYGVLERWFLEVYGAWENHPGSSDESTTYEATELENKFQLSEQGEYWLDFGFLVENEFAAEDEGQDELKLVPLFQKDWDQWTHKANPFVEYKYDGEAEEEWEAGVSWSTSYRVHPSFEPGLELHWNYGDLSESKPFDEQAFQLGPVVYGTLGPVKYDIGYLFGISEDSPDGELKWIVEFEHHF